MSARQEGSGSIRQQILEAAAMAIARRGFHGMSMRELARSTGRGLASFYNYFSSKEELLVELQERAFNTLIETAQRATAGVDDPADRLYALIYTHIRYVAEHPDVMRVLVQEGASLPKEQRGSIRRLKESYFALARSIVRELVLRGCGHKQARGTWPGDEAELQRATYSIFGMLNWVYGWYEPEQHGSAEDVTETVHRLALCGLVAHCPLRKPSAPLRARLTQLNTADLLQTED